MKLKDLLFEVRIFQNNFIKVDMIKDELKMIFNNTDVPEISFDADGMYIAMDNFKLREFDNYGGFKKFSILFQNFHFLSLFFLPNIRLLIYLIDCQSLH